MLVAFPVMMSDGETLADPSPIGWEARCLQEWVGPAVLTSLGVSEPKWAGLCLLLVEPVGGTCWDVSDTVQSGSRTEWGGGRGGGWGWLPKAASETAATDLHS